MARMRGAALLVLCARAQAQDYSSCSADPSDPSLTEYDADPPVSCSTTGCLPGQKFNSDWDEDGSGCMDGHHTGCCYPCDPNFFQAVDSTGDYTVRTDSCTMCDAAVDLTTGAWLSPPQYVSSGCGNPNANPATMTAQSVLTECSTPSATQFVSTRCIPGSPDSPGTDTELTDCTQPNATQMTTVPCFSGSVAECTANFPITAVSGPLANNPNLASLEDCVHAFDGATKAPQDTVLVNCEALTPSGSYVSVACVNGAHDTLGVAPVVSECKKPAALVAGMLPTEYVSTVCAPGTPTEVGTDTVISKCTMPEDTGYLTGTYVIEECMPGSSTTAGKDTLLGDCDDATTVAEGCPILNDDCIAKCEVGTGTWVALVIFLLLATGGAVFAYLYKTEHPDVMGGEIRRGVAFEPFTAPGKFIYAADNNPKQLNMTTGLKLGPVDWEGKVTVSGDKTALFVECKAGGAYKVAAMAAGRGYRLCNNTLCLAPGAEIKLSEPARVEADRYARLISKDGLLPDELKGGLNGPIGRGIQVMWTTDSNKGLEFLVEGALNKDVEAVSLAVRMEGEEDGSEEKYYLRHDESKIVLQRDTHADPNASSWYIRKPDYVAVLMGKKTETQDGTEVTKQQNPIDTESQDMESQDDDQTME